LGGRRVEKIDISGAGKEVNVNGYQGTGIMGILMLL